MEKEEIKLGILYLLCINNKYGGYTLIEIRDFLKDNNIEHELRPLRQLLMEMEDEKLILENHFKSDKFDGRVDYTLKNEGFQFMNKKVPDFAAFQSRWKAPLPVKEE